MKNSIVHQDNKSTIVLTQNGRASFSKRTRHINIRYFFITDRIKAGDLAVEYCPTGDMVADYFTKPLQGALFKKMRNLIMNIDPSDATRWRQRQLAERPSGTKHVTREEQDWKKVGFSKTVKGALQPATFPTFLVGSGLIESSSLCLLRHCSLRVAYYSSQGLPVQTRFNNSYENIRQ
jgi:hypothetical protein